ncbi:PepSY domain-containing protein [Porphyromonadaceae bacterium W3.11]|nr:PepSY domain-containing protein [Porphyromonadaceae bacterium W3.11]
MKVFKVIHKWLGVIMAPLMVMWFISGFFMIFSGFPRVENSSRFSLLDTLSSTDSLPHASQLRSWYIQKTKSGAELTEIGIEKSPRGLFLNLSGTEGNVMIEASNGEVAKVIKPSIEDIEEMTYRITQQSPMRIDTLNNLEQWIPFSAQRAEFPIYKVAVNDGHDTHLYFSGQSGRLLQQTNSNNRLLACFGAIPHWLYFWPIRQNIDLWINIFIVLGIVGCLMIISGLVMGIFRTSQARKGKGKKWSPYKKRWYYWHHITGLIFGIFVLTWMFSGWMSLDKLPSWMTGPTPDKEYYTLSRSLPITSGINLDFDKAIEIYPNAKRITYGSYLGQGYYVIEDGTSKEYVQIEDGIVQPLKVSEEQAKTYLTAELPQVKIESCRTLTDYTANYLPHPKGRHKPPLPVFEVKTDDGTTLYMASTEPRVQVTNKATVLNSWAYQKLHAFKFLWAYHHPALWMALMLILLSGGTLVSITGIVLAWNVLRRQFKGRKKNS